MSTKREERQRWIAEFIRGTWGYTNMASKERAMRLLEEAIELAQAEDINPLAITHLVDHVYRKQPGSVEREAGGVAVCLLAYCESVGRDADEIEIREVERLKTKDRDHFRRRHQVKVEAGVAEQGILPK